MVARRVKQSEQEQLEEKGHHFMAASAFRSSHSNLGSLTVLCLGSRVSPLRTTVACPSAWQSRRTCFLGRECCLFNPSVESLSGKITLCLGQEIRASQKPPGGVAIKPVPEAMDTASPLKKQKLPPFDLNAAAGVDPTSGADLAESTAGTNAPLSVLNTDLAPSKAEPIAAPPSNQVMSNQAGSVPLLEHPAQSSGSPPNLETLTSLLPNQPLKGIPLGLSPRAQRAWEHYRKLGSPWKIVAPMVDQSELPFRMLCRKHGADAAYTPMLHSRLFVDSERYRKEHFTTCPVSRPAVVHSMERSRGLQALVSWGADLRLFARLC